MSQRTISRITRSRWHTGFLGTGHTASAVFESVPFQDTDPFILFMDDKINLPGGEPVGGAHPHAGFETLTLVLKGNERNLHTGSFELMTAGKGIVHTEEISLKENLHILQVWLALPPEKRWVQPFWQKMLAEDVPTIKTDEYQIRVYSGASNGLVSPIINHTPLTLVEFQMKKNQTVLQEIPATQNGLVYVLEGTIQIAGKTIMAGQAGWLNKVAKTTEDSILTFHSVNNAHFLLYAALPHNVPLVSHGPFIGDTTSDIKRLFKDYRSGRMPHVNNLPLNQKINHKKKLITKYQ